MSNKKEESNQEMLATLIDLAYNNEIYGKINNFLKYDLSPELLQKLYEMWVLNYMNNFDVSNVFKNLNEKGKPMDLDKLFTLYQKNLKWNGVIWTSLLKMGQPKDKVKYVKSYVMQDKITEYVLGEVLSGVKFTKEEFKYLLDSTHPHYLNKFKIEKLLTYFFRNFKNPEVEAEVEAEVESKETKVESKVESKVETKDEAKVETKDETKDEIGASTESADKKDLPNLSIDECIKRGYCFCGLSNKIGLLNSPSGKQLLEYYISSRCRFSLGLFKRFISEKVVTLDLKDKEVRKLLFKLSKEDMGEIFETQLNTTYNS